MALAAAVGGHRTRDGHFEGRQIESRAIECAVADFMALVRATAQATGNTEYDVRAGIEWTGEQPLTIFETSELGHVYDRDSTPLYRYTPVDTTVNAAEPDLDLHWHVHELATDCVNQGGIPTPN